MPERNADETWMRFGSVVTGTGDVLGDTAVRIVGGRIAEIAAGGRAPRGAIERPTQTLAPGFVDAHAHLCFGYADDHDTVRRAAEHAELSRLRATAADHAIECLYGGVTTVRDCGDRGFATLSVRDDIANGHRPGPLTLTAGPPVTTVGGHLNWCGGAIDPAGDTAAAVDRLSARGVDFVKVLASGGGMTTESDPHHPQFSLEQLQQLTGRARHHGIRVAAHAHSSEAIRLCVAAGVNTIEHCSWKSEDGSVRMLDDVANAIIANEISVVLTMAGIQRAFLPHRSTPAHELSAALASSATGSLAGDFAWAREMLARGARIVIASDAGVRFTPFSGFIESVRCGVLALDTPGARAIEMATLVAARAIGVDDRVGSIEVGKHADLIALDGPVTPETRWLPDIASVWKSGQLVR